jgi:hypothetical protein
MHVFSSTLYLLGSFFVRSTTNNAPNPIYRELASIEFRIPILLALISREETFTINW